MTRVVVVGGGVTGLAAARRLALVGAEVTVLEQSSRWGGKLDRTVVAGAGGELALDTGPESMLARRTEAVTLVGELGLTGQLVHPTRAKPQLLVGGRLLAMPPSLQGVPVDVAALGELLSAEGRAYAEGEPQRPAPPLPGDVTIGDYVDERFGREVTDRLLEPLLGGVYAGRPRQLSFAAVAPALYGRARAGGSLLGHARAGLQPGLTTPVFAGLVGGVSGLVRGLVADLEQRGVELRAGVAVHGLTPRNGRWRVWLGPKTRSQQQTLDADAVVLALPAAAAGRLLLGVVSTAESYGAVPYASVAVVTLVVRGLATASSGLLVPPGQLPTVKAFTHSSVKWDWVREQAEQVWGSGVAVVRASVGRFGETGLMQVDDRTLVERTFAEARTLPGWSGATLVEARLTRWGGGLPQYLVGHRELVQTLRAELADLPGLAVAGAALDGVGIPACLASADAAVAKVIADLGRANHDQQSSEHDQLEGSRR